MPVGTGILRLSYRKEEEAPSHEKAAGTFGIWNLGLIMFRIFRYSARKQRLEMKIELFIPFSILIS